MNGLTWKTEAELIKITAFPLVISTLLLVVLILINEQFELHWFTFILHCKKPERPIEFDLPISNLFPFRAICLVLATILECKTLYLILKFKNQASQGVIDLQTEQRHSQMNN